METKAKKRIQVKIDKDLANNVEEVLDDLGLIPTTASTMFYKRICVRMDRNKRYLNL